ncbi:hypothetical protein M1567_03095 [Candidatus Marsarchaeota archaeon]|jgi:hypothetical protein|nr:hypothetical protein [Candidatus Marsarchaeota archaeon]
MMNIFRIMKHRRLERFLEIDSMNARPVAMIKESANVYRFVWADESD